MFDNNVNGPLFALQKAGTPFRDFNRWKFIGIVISGLLVLALLVRALFFTFVEKHELGYKFNRWTGKVTELNRSGYHQVMPFSTSVYVIDLRPVQIKIEANLGSGTDVNTRILNAMLVEFRREGLAQFITMHGISDRSLSEVGEILKAYAYENIATEKYSIKSNEEKYKFLGIKATTSSSDQSLIQETQNPENEK